MTSEGTQYVKLLEYQIAKGVKEAGKGFGKVGASSFNIVTKLIEVDMTSKHGS